MPLETNVRHDAFAEFNATLPRDCTSCPAIRVHYCHSCHELLAVCEIVKAPDATALLDSCRPKAPSVAERMGARLQVPVYRITYTEMSNRLTAVAQAGHAEVLLMPRDEVARFIARLHDCDHYKRHRTGSFAL
jgi:hypothetical protein